LDDGLLAEYGIYIGCVFLEVLVDPDFAFSFGIKTYQILINKEFFSKMCEQFLQSIERLFQNVSHLFKLDDTNISQSVRNSLKNDGK
jgi:hypothetical protein